MENEDLSILIKSAQGGSATDMATLASRFQKMIVVNCALRLDDNNQVEDVAQEVTEQLLSSLSQLRSPEAFTSWLEKIIVHTCIRNNKSSRSRKVREVGLEADDSQSLVDRLVEKDVNRLPEANFAQNQAREHLLSHIQQLPQSQRVPLVLHYFGALSYRQIAEVLRIKTGTVSSNISKGKRSLNQRLLDEL
ncbi:MAG: RNA polymerase sigma factor [Coriobacteriales bacterium]|jgi:RNA polymerase sigma-70 factor (ECF subfamily)|nr:RNA polymerase sigma factor [Coriobacteriales bacterium]